MSFPTTFKYRATLLQSYSLLVAVGKKNFFQGNHYGLVDLQITSAPGLRLHITVQYIKRLGPALKCRLDISEIAAAYPCKISYKKRMQHLTIFSHLNALGNRFC